MQSLNCLLLYTKDKFFVKERMETPSTSMKVCKQRWDLDDKNYVEISRHNRVAFRHHTNLNNNNYYGVSLMP